MGARIRVVIAKPGLDGHDRGAKVVARALRDAGMEVIYTGLHQTPEQVVETAIQEDADAVGLSVLSGAHMTLFRRVVELLAERGADDIVVFGGGIIPDADIPELERIGVAKVFTPGASTESIVEWVRRNVRAGVPEPDGVQDGRRRKASHRRQILETPTTPPGRRMPPSRQTEGGAGRTPHTPGPSYARRPAATPRPTGHRPLCRPAVAFADVLLNDRGPGR